jgi:membrane-associated phospholipid phosphatase
MWGHLSQRLLAVTVAAALTSASHAQDTQVTKSRRDDARKANASPAKMDSGDQKSAYQLLPGEDPQNRLVAPLLKHLATDQKDFWTSPARWQRKDLRWALPFTAFTGGVIASDNWISRQVPDKASQLKHSQDISNYSLYSLIGAGGGAFLWGHITNNDHLKETGLLSGEAAINSTSVAYLFKGITQRPRPLEGNNNGTFFTGGSSFPSEHTAVAWSAATVFAHEYPGPLSKFFAYGLASAVTLTRITGKQHFPSDALIGSALGWYFGRQAYRAHHEAELGGAAWGDFLERDEEEKPRNPANMSSPYVPLDSWVYDSLTRLAALGYIQTAYMGQRPWTRMECARLLEEAADRMTDDSMEDDQWHKIYSALAEEFDSEIDRLNGSRNLGASLDSVYTRVTNISGRPLRDGYHFGQTIINDFGRPYSEGLNTLSGITAHAVAGPFSFYVRGEYQHAPSSASDPPQVQQAIANADLTRPLSNGIAEINRFRMLDSTVALQIHNVQISFGKQSQWLGPNQAGPLLFSDNAEPIVMLKIDNVSPYKIPLLSRVLGPARSEFFLGQLAGHQFEVNGSTLLGPGNIDPQPYLHGFKISFRPIPDLEFGMGITAQFAGPGLPFTWHNFLRTFYSHTSGSNNPGKRLSAFDFSYRVPGLRKWLTIYSDSMVVDEFSPINSNRPVLNFGVYLPQIPKVPRMEIRAEGLGTPHGHEFAPGFVYYGLRRYRSGYTNEGNLLGSWIGRAGRGAQGWATYSFSPHNRLELGYRYQKVDRQFIEGGHLSDFSLRSDYLLRTDIGLSGSVQYEHWEFPILSPAAQTDVTVSFQLTFYPHWKIR